MPPSGDETPFAAPLDIRYVGVVGGRYTLSRPQGDDSPAIVYACRTQSISPTLATIAGPVGQVDQAIGLVLEHLGLLKGQITRRFPGGFEVELSGGLDDQRKLAAKINWLKKRSLRQVHDKRDAPRQRPRNPTAHFYLGDEEHECFLIDVSFSGAGVSSANRPAIGTTLKIGEVSAHVIRHMDVGFGVQFDLALTADSLEQRLHARSGSDEA